MGPGDALASEGKGMRVPSVGMAVCMAQELVNNTGI